MNKFRLLQLIAANLNATQGITLNAASEYNKNAYNVERHTRKKAAKLSAARAVRAHG